MSSRGWERDGGAEFHDLQPIIKVQPEPSLLDPFLHVAIRCRDDAHIGVECLGSADTLELAFLEKPQERRLSLQRQFADLIEEERASVRRFDFSLLLGDGAAEGAALVSEQFAFDQAVDDGVTMDRGKWSVLPPAVPVDVARGPILSFVCKCC